MFALVSKVFRVIKKAQTEVITIPFPMLEKLQEKEKEALLEVRDICVQK